MSAPHGPWIDFGPSTVTRERISDLWRAGANSADIARTTGIQESVVCQVLIAQQDVRHALRQRHAQRATARTPINSGDQAHA